MIAPLTLAAQPQPAPVISSYAIEAELDPAAHRLTATAVVSFSVPVQAETLSFALDPELKMRKITDENGALLVSERAAEGGLRVTPAKPLAAGQTAHWRFEYEGTVTNGGANLQAAKLAAIDEPVSYLLNAAHWFPVAAEMLVAGAISATGEMTNRFTAAIKIRVPQGMMVLASGTQGAATPVTLANGKAGDEYAFNWTKPGLPGTVIAGRFAEPVSAGNVKLYLSAEHQKSAEALAQTAARESEFFTATFGAPQSSQLNVVELPAGTLTSVWAPELAAIPASLVAEPSAARLLANTIARQWWSSELSPRTPNDAWITNGMARYSELLFVENQSGASALQAALPDVAAGALAYDTVPLSSAARLSPLSTDFQSMTMEKGAMIFHMLRGELGDKAFAATLKKVLSQYGGGSIDAAEFEKVAEAEGHLSLRAFFSQWVDGTGAPQFVDKYAIYRLGNNKGFRTAGEIDQDLDLFRMPVELSVETDGKTETQKIEVVGPSTSFSIESFGRPRHIVIDPQDWVLKSTPELQVRVGILRGQRLVAENNLTGALAEYQKALEIDALSSLVSYRIGDVLFAQHNYQASANAFRDALRGDGEPRWTEVWSHIQLGKIFDATGQRDRAVNEYRLAEQTGDNAQGAVNQARQYLQKPYSPPENK